MRQYGDLFSMAGVTEGLCSYSHIPYYSYSIIYSFVILFFVMTSFSITIFYITFHCTITDWAKVLRPTRHKIGHFRDVLPNKSLDLVLEKLDVTQQKQTTQNKMTKKHKININLKKTKTLTNNQLYELFICVCIWLRTTVVHNTA